MTQAQSSTLFQKINGDIGNKALSKAIKAYKADDLSSACFQASIAKISYLEAEFDKPYESALNFEKFVCNR